MTDENMAAGAATGGEGAQHWRNVLTGLRNCGLADVLTCCCDGLKGLPEAIVEVWPLATAQADHLQDRARAGGPVLATAGAGKSGSGRRSGLRADAAHPRRWELDQPGRSLSRVDPVLRSHTAGVRGGADVLRGRGAFPGLSGGGPGPGGGLRRHPGPGGSGRVRQVFVHLAHDGVSSAPSPRRKLSHKLDAGHLAAWPTVVGAGMGVGWAVDEQGQRECCDADDGHDRERSAKARHIGGDFAVG